MPDQNLTEIICIIDRSGSMESIRNDAIGGFNAFLDEQKKLPGRALLSYVQFDDRYDVVHDGKVIQNVPPLTTKTYVPRGMTALLDAIGRTLNTVEARLADIPEEQQPGKVIVLILTDGEENASKEFDLAVINKMISDRRDKHAWEFVFLAAGQDAIATGSALGIAHSANFAATGAGVAGAYASLSRIVTGFRTSGKVTDVDDSDLQ